MEQGKFLPLKIDAKQQIFLHVLSLFLYILTRRFSLGCFQSNDFQKLQMPSEIPA
jgi:hypothetical protein